jgi:phage tail-like protein
LVVEFEFRALTAEDWKDLDSAALIGKGGALRLKDGEDGENRPTTLLDTPLNEDEKEVVISLEGSHRFSSLDSGIPGCRWHRAVLDAEIPENSTVTITFRTSESDGGGGDSSEPVTFVSEGPRDCLIQAPPGRYIEVEVKLRRMNRDTPSPIFGRLIVYYPRRSYLGYLPSVYQKDEASRDFLERFLSVFESELYESEETISRISSYFDPMAAPGEFVPWLATWLSLDLYELLGEKNREFVLRAVEFYKKKGTASGLADLVAFLTGRRCCVKEYANNIFRSYGMEHDEEDEPIKRSGSGCERFPRGPSRTVDTRNLDLLAKMETFFDEVHYTVDAGEMSRYSRNSIGLFIFLGLGEDLVIDKDELRKIIESFLPVFVRFEITTTFEWVREHFDLAEVTDVYCDHLSIHLEEKMGMAEGYYRDAASWRWLRSCRKSERSNDRGYRTPHSGLDVDLPL